MSDILTVVFRTFMSHTGLKTDLAADPPPPAATTRSALVVGDHSVSRSVLLLAAVTAASHLGLRVMFFTRTQIQSLPASLQKCVPSLSPESLKVQVTPLPNCGTVEELLHQIASLHESTNTSPTPPSLIIVDRLEGFLRGHSELHPGEQSCAAHLSALLCDTAAFLTQVLEKRPSSSGPCRVIASFRSQEDAGQAGGEASATDPVLDILDRYFQVRCTLDQDRGYEAAAAGLQQVWNIYLSGRGIADASDTKDCEDRPAEAQEWQLLIYPDGLMEFKVV
ncbi:putative ATPase SWSAP1 [Scophthalmus maximus]|uniref:Putative ATPase SWSAP1 n=1 Tax=Scophthalmus maximus TaxID=52904 RepID=A0A2U9CR88_SCOMX|nr:putative ATPase SWSAP1 [Scophthalmus maximus]